MTLRAGTRLGPYEISAPIGAGGMGEVYRARDTRLGRDVAVKVLPQHLIEKTEAKQRFEREARAVSSLNHPNICTLYDIGHQDGVDYLVMEFLEGETLTTRLHRAPPAMREGAAIILQVARGLAEAHSHGIIHRDIKPSNIVLTKLGTAKIIDFGLARALAADAATRTQGSTAGTIGYMSPEQARGATLDARTDVWSLGVVLAETLTGANPFQRESPSAILVAILDEPPAAMANIPGELQKIVYRALAKNADARYPDCREMAEDLETFRSTSAAAAQQMVDPQAPTATLRSAQIQEYISQASGGSWRTDAQRRGLSGRWLAIAALIVAVAGVATFPWTRSRLAAAFFDAGEKHVAVLPFDNIGNNPSNAPLAEGLMDSLSGALSNLDVGNQSLWVVPATVVRRSKVSDPSAALRELGATLVVEGSIEREGQDVHLNVNLINAKTLRQVGSAELEDRAGDLATLQDEAVSRLAKLMGISVTPEMLKNTGGKVNPAAYESYLAALGYIQRYDKPGNLDLAVASLNDAVKTDPTFAVGYAELAEAYRRKYGLDPNPKWIDEATANCDKAAQLDPNLPSVYMTLARTHAMLAKYDLALEEFQRALQVDPHNADALEGLGGTYERMGRIADAETTYKRAIALQPDNWDLYNSLGMFYSRRGRYQDALAQYRRVISLAPDNANAYGNLASVYLDMGDPKLLPDAEQALQKSIQITPSYPTYANLGLLYYNEKRYADSAAMTEKALALNDNDYRVWSNLVATYEWLKDEGKAAAARERELQLVEDGVKRQPQDAVAQSELADIYAAQEARDKALIRIQSALAISPDDSRVLVNVGEAYERLGQRAEALRYVERALQKGYSLDDLKSDPQLQGLLSDSNFHTKGK